MTTYNNNNNKPVLHKNYSFGYKKNSRREIQFIKFNTILLYYLQL